MRILLLTLILYLTWTPPAYAYIDPGSVFLFIQGIIGAFAAFALFFRTRFAALLDFFKNKFASAHKGTTSVTSKNQKDNSKAERDK